jgi:hypothetical protein
VRGLMAAVIGMGILIVAGVTVLVVVMVQRMSAPPAPIASAVIATPTVPAATAAADILIDEPAGTRIGSLSLAGDHLALQLAGGGPDRVVVVDTRNGRVIARTALAR